MQVFWTGSKGWGIKVLEDVPKGAFVLEMVGEIVTNAKMLLRTFERRTEGVDPYQHTLSLDADWRREAVVDDDDALYIDGSRFSNVGRFLNHRYERIFLPWVFPHCWM
jgi:hypothetical protein